MVTFGQLKSRMINILMSALQVETDSQNTHMLLGALLLCVQDSVIHEELDSSSSDVQSSSAPETNLLSSGEKILNFNSFLLFLAFNSLFLSYTKKFHKTH